MEGKLAEDLAPQALDGYNDLVAAVYKEVKNLILTQKLLPGTKINQADLAQTLGVSRTPLLKALHLLKGDNLVIYLPRRGFCVKEFTVKELAEVLYIRALLDGAVAREVALNATEEELEKLSSFFEGFTQSLAQEERTKYFQTDQKFHEYLYIIAEMPLLRQINNTFCISSISYQRRPIRDPRETILEHQSLIQALKDRDAELAEKVAKSHVMRARTILLKGGE